MLAATLAAGGYRAVWQLPSHPWQIRTADVVLWDGWPNAQLQSQLPAESRPSQVVLLDFARWNDRKRALESGATEIVTRPFQLSQLWSTIDAAVAARRPAPVQSQIAAA